MYNSLNTNLHRSIPANRVMPSVTSVLEKLNICTAKFGVFFLSVNKILKPQVTN
jgi:hypothetical protein